MPPLLRATATAVNRSDEPRLRLPAACRGRCARVERDLRSGPRRVRALAIFGRSSRAWARPVDGRRRPGRVPTAALPWVGAPAVSANSRRTSARTAFGSAVCGRSGAAYTSASTTSSTTPAGSGTRGGRSNARSPASRRRRSAQQASHSATCSSSIRRAAGESASSTRATSSAPRPGHRSSSWRPSDAAAGVASQRDRRTTGDAAQVSPRHRVARRRIAPLPRRETAPGRGMPRRRPGRSSRRARSMRTPVWPSDCTAPPTRPAPRRGPATNRGQARRTRAHPNRPRGRFGSVRRRAFRARSA